MCAGADWQWAVWQPGGRRIAECQNNMQQAGVMAESPALIPLVGNNSRFHILFTTKTLIYRLQ